MDSTLFRLLDNNPIKKISELAFANAGEIGNLDLSYTKIDHLPLAGLEKTKHLALKGVPDLKELAPMNKLIYLAYAELTYPYHCCHFQRYDSFSHTYAGCEKKGSADNPSTTDLDDELDLLQIQFEVDELPDDESMMNSYDYDDSLKTKESKEKIDMRKVLSYYRSKENECQYVRCTPQPDALNPCEDLINYWWLRIVCWFVWILAVMGNAIVITVLLACSRQFRQHVNHFLILNLAIADFSLGTYLALLAIKDLTTAGNYHNYAVDWQTGFGCQLAGFLAVFASELSILSMVLISIEAWYNTKYLFYGHRFRLKVAVLLVILCYALALSAASLPLTGLVSDYSSTSTCLPLRFHFLSDKIFISVIFGVNMCAFAYIVCNYVAVYVMVSGSSAPMVRKQDISIAKRMAILIGSDFLCWAPIIFFGLHSAFGTSLISISSSKILLVLFFPINAFANPFLYVFLTKMFRKDMSSLTRKYTLLRKLRSWKNATNYWPFGGSNSSKTNSRQIFPLQRRSWSNILLNSSNVLNNVTLETLASMSSGRNALDKKGSAGSCSTRMSDLSTVHRLNVMSTLLKRRRKSGPEKTKHMHIPLSTYYMDSPPAVKIEQKVTKQVLVEKANSQKQNANHIRSHNLKCNDKGGYYLCPFSTTTLVSRTAKLKRCHSDPCSRRPRDEHFNV